MIKPDHKALPTEAKAGDLNSHARVIDDVATFDNTQEAFCSAVAFFIS